MNHTVLQTKGLCKTYIVNKHQNNVLKNINLTISNGEMVAVMGPSGSGKSTLLYCVSGMDKVTAGEVFFNGRETNVNNLTQATTTYCVFLLIGTGFPVPFFIQDHYLN